MGTRKTETSAMENMITATRGVRETRAPHFAASQSQATIMRSV